VSSKSRRSVWDQPQFAPGLLIILLLACSAVGCGESRGPAASDRSHHSWFADITSVAQVEFIHQTGPTGRYLMPEQMGSGAALFDYDNDGRLDIYLLHNAGPDSGATNQLLHQEPDGTFRDSSAASGLNVQGFCMGATVGDINNDGLRDVLLTEYTGIRLFLNLGLGRFKDVTQMTGLDNPRWATAAAFFDYDRDGWLDLVVGNYLDFDSTQICRNARGELDFCGPEGFPGLVTRLFRNTGLSSATMSIPTFQDVTVAAGLGGFPGPALGIICADFDGDSWPDIFVADDGRPNRLFVNQRDGSFTEEGVLRGLAFTAMGQAAADMGVACGDVDGNGLFDLFATHLATEPHSLWTQQPRGLFHERMSRSGLARQAWRGTGFGAVLVDFNQDGALDLAFVNGRVQRSEHTQQPVAPGVQQFWVPYAQRNQLFVNNRHGIFQDISDQNPAFCSLATVGRGLVHGDIDNDGAVDLLVTTTGGPAMLLRNVAPGTGNWLTIQAIDTALGGRDAYGAEIIVRAGRQRWWRLCQPASGYLSSHDPRLHFGLGNISEFDSIRVAWPDGTEESFPGGPVNRSVTLRKGEGQQNKPVATDTR
jgi:hypothetical protein